MHFQLVLPDHLLLRTITPAFSAYKHWQPQDHNHCERENRNEFLDNVQSSQYKRRVSSGLRIPNVSGSIKRLTGSSFTRPSFETRNLLTLAYHWTSLRDEIYGKPHFFSSVYAFLHLLNAVREICVTDIYNLK